MLYTIIIYSLKQVIQIPTWIYYVRNYSGEGIKQNSNNLIKKELY